jgi:hypothetical protein
MVGEKATALISSGQERLETLPYHFFWRDKRLKKIARFPPPSVFPWDENQAQGRILNE